MIKTPLAERIKIVILGKRNAGKSSLINQISSKNVAIVSDYAGTTTDPVFFSMELGEVGPVTFIDTAGFDDEGELGKLRISRTLEKLEIADLCIFVTPATDNIDKKELEFYKEIKDKKPIIIVFTFFENKIDDSKKFLLENQWVGVDNIKGIGILELRKKIIQMKEFIKSEPGLLDGLVKEEDFVLLVTPIDLAAPKGRLILPQVEAIRELLDKDCGVMIVKERELKIFYDRLKIKPSLVITDSQVFHKVAADITSDQPLTSFSILMARKKGELLPFIESIERISKLKAESKILILEMYNHHRQPDDIGTVKIPRLVNQMIEPTISFEWKKQVNNVNEIKGFDAIIMCGGCMVSRQQYSLMMKMIIDENIPLLNYGLFFAWVNGLLPRAIEAFPEVYERYLALNL
jgi:[FeFe] hydrogenase H-cluster maturation GTPase HydF